MNLDVALVSTAVAIVLVAAVYSHVGWTLIVAVYKMWFDKKYWTSYNVVEALSWFAKAVIIVLGLVFGITVWWMHIITLVTSLMLIWASNRKMLPTLVAFNTLWVWLSSAVLIEQFVD